MTGITEENQNLKALCRDCLTAWQDGDYSDHAAHDRRCKNCGSRRILSHPELGSLSIAHVDCDAFFAAVEKRDNPDIRHKPVIIGGGGRGVVSTACYIARMSGVRSAMPMFKAKQLCPDAVIIRGNMQKYKEAGHQIRALFSELTPLVEPLSIDEAFLDLSGTAAYHGGKAPALLLAELSKAVEKQVGISISIGLAANKFLAKLASDMDKPRGFTVISQAEARQVLAPLPISRIYGIGKAMTLKLERQGLTTINQLQQMDDRQLMHKFGETGLRLYHLSRGIDKRPVKTGREIKSVSGETTFTHDIRDLDTLETSLWKQCERVSKDLKKKQLAAQTITLKLKNSSHKSVTRSHTLDSPTQMASKLYEIGGYLLRPLVNGQSYRLLGISGSNLTGADFADPPDLIEPNRNKMTAAEKAMDKLRAKFGDDSILKGRSLNDKTIKKQ